MIREFQSEKQTPSTITLQGELFLHSTFYYKLLYLKIIATRVYTRPQFPWVSTKATSKQSKKIVERSFQTSEILKRADLTEQWIPDIINARGTTVVFLIVELSYIRVLNGMKLPVGAKIRIDYI